MEYLIGIGSVVAIVALFVVAYFILKAWGKGMSQ